jgi:hypothetical protein
MNFKPNLGVVTQELPVTVYKHFFLPLKKEQIFRTRCCASVSDSRDVSREAFGRFHSEISVQ